MQYGDCKIHPSLQPLKRRKRHQRTEEELIRDKGGVTTVFS